MIDLSEINEKVNDTILNLFIKKIKERYILGEKIQDKEIDKIKKIIKQ